MRVFAPLTIAGASLKYPTVFHSHGLARARGGGAEVVLSPVERRLSSMAGGPFYDEIGSPVTKSVPVKAV